MSGGLELAGRIALVAEASGGIGGAICRRLASDVAGIALAYGGHAEPAEALAAEIVSGGGIARAFGADMADPNTPERLIDEVEAALGPVDILIANHGIARPARYEDIDATTFEHTLAVNLRAPFLLARDGTLVAEHLQRDLKPLKVIDRYQHELRFAVTGHGDPLVLLADPVVQFRQASLDVAER